MSFFLDILRWIFGGKPIDQRKEEDVEEYILTCYGSRFSHSIYSSNSTLMISQYDAQFHRENHWNSSFKFPQTSITPTVHTSRGSTGNTNSQSYVSQSKASITNPVITKPSEQGSQPNSSWFSSKPSSSLSEPSPYVSQSKASNPVITKPREQGSQPNSSLFSSKPSSSLSEPSAYVSQSKASNRVITKPSEQGSQPNSSLFSSKPSSSLSEPSAYVSQSKASNRVITKPSEQGSQPNSSLFSSKPSSSLSEPSAYVSQSKASNRVLTKPSEQGSQPNSSRFSSQPSSSSSKPYSSLSEPSAYSSKESRCLSGSGLQSLPKPTPSSPSTSSSSSSGTPSSSLKPPPPFTKPTLSLASPNQNNQQTKTNYFWVEKGVPPIYVPPAHIKDSIKNDIVPGILKKPLSAPTYKDYFGALLYAEDYYFEKWDGFEMKNVTLELHEAEIYTKKGKCEDLNKFAEKDDKIFVEFEIDFIPARRPFLLSRDFAFVRPSGRNVEPFQGIIYRVAKSNLVLVEFGEDFRYQHDSACKYDVKFSFNRACLKRAYQAIAAASDRLFQNFLFPHVPRNSLSAFQVLPRSHKLDREQVSAVQQILSLDTTPPYLVEGSLSVVRSEQLSRTGMVVQEAVIQIYRTSPSCRILICAPINRTCDVLMRCLKKEIPESEMFRANAAFRELDGVPCDILPSCLYKGECFSCPSLQELRKFKVILSTFMSSYRLHGEGIVAGDFSHIFLVDASSATEPETMVTLANLANEKTAVVISGASNNRSGWVRSKTARQNGLMTSYFERLRESKLYKSLDPKLITRLQDSR